MKDNNNKPFDSTEWKKYRRGSRDDSVLNEYRHKMKFYELQASLDRQFDNLTKAFRELAKDPKAEWTKDLEKHVEAGMNSHKFYNGGAKEALDKVGYHPETYKYVEKENRRIANITEAINNYVHKRKLN